MHALGYAACVASVIAINVIERWVMGRYGRASDRDAPSDQGTLNCLSASLAVGVVLAFIPPVVLPGLDFPLPLWLTLGGGLCVAWLGALLRFWSIKHLGRYFVYIVAIDADQPLITDGPFRLLRHPSYTGVLMMCAGLGLALDNVISFVVLCGLLAYALYRRIVVEEAALEQAFGDAFRDYRRHSWRVVPLMW